MEFNEYFQKELIILRELGREAAARNPALAPFFDTPGRDADVERLLEGFAFLGGRLRQKLDDELPEITHGLFSRLWPNYLRPLPAASIIQYRPDENVTGSKVITKGSLVTSVPIEGTPCTFQTVYDTEILPLKIVGQRFLERNGAAVLAISFALTSGSLGTLPLSSLRFFFTGKESVAYTLQYTLAYRVQRIRFIVRDENKEEHCTTLLEPSVIKPVGFHEQEGLYPYPEKTALGYRIIQEYFCFPEKFLFVEIGELGKGIRGAVKQNLQDAKEFELHFVLEELPQEYEEFEADNWRLFCTPVVNLFPLSELPMTLASQHREHRIVPDPRRPEHFAVYSVDRVSNFTTGKDGEIYENFDSFERTFSTSATSPAYHLHIRPGMSGDDVETYITVDAEEQDKAVLKMDLTCTNRVLPRQLGLGDICEPAGKGSGSAVPFTNILPVTAPYPPPIEGDLLWRLLSNMSLNPIPLTDVVALRRVISTYNFRAIHEHRCAREMEKKLEGMISVVSVETDRIFKGLPMRGTQTRITLNQDAFSCKGALHLFGAALNEFLAMYATANSFQQLTVVEAKTAATHQYPARFGSLIRR